MDKKGYVMVFLPIIFIVLFGFIGLAIDLSIVVYNKQHLQDVVDFAAISSIQEATKNKSQVIRTSREYLNKNGINDIDIVKIIYPYDGDDYKIKISASRKVKLTFLSILGFKETTVLVNSIAKLNRDLRYAIFQNSNDVLYINTAIRVEGNIHSNGDINLQSRDIIVNGIVEGVGKINSRTTNVSQFIENCPYIKMPYYNIQDYRNKATIYYNNSITIDNKLTLNQDQIIFVNGDITVKAKTEGRGKIIATGNITFTGNDIIYGTDKDEIMFMAGRNIWFSGTKSQYSGIFYTYSGEINFSCSNSSVYGRLYANKIKLIGGNNQIYPYNMEISDTWSTSLVE
ncbi:TadE/TadG family type IV pilus assembly protein [Alkalithermobacter paradoxus]|uniref:Putative Flp pilus-assembly TadG-like N-terminal domain-containing protein n=1 Tax=Alkalithermobacter paradoxus TaxID=29349 RepID=A0A1V4I8Y8_9FIRM|nr:hypothetical protein CLOTH_07870 [[Clostridium] thermoalcaliphilum]